MAQGKALAVALVGAGAIAAFAFQGSAHAEPAEEPKKKPKGKVNRLTLSLKYAKLFGVPASLVLATTYAQSKNNAKAYRANSRGGAWGYGQMTLATAKEMWPMVKGKIAKTWDGTGKGLLDPEINLTLTAHYLGMWWKRYKANRLGWILSAYAYILGPGRVRQIMPKDSGKLPKTLPADFARVKSAYAQALGTSEVKKAVAQDKTKTALSGAEGPLYGKALANTIPATTTGYGARKMFGEMVQALKNAYGTLQTYDPNKTAQRSGLDAGSVKKAREYLDSTNATLAKYYKDMPESSAKLTAQQLKELKASASISSAAVKTVNDLFGTSWAMELTREIGKAAVAVPKAVIHGAAEAIGLDKTSAAIAVVGIAAVGVLVLAIKK